MVVKVEKTHVLKNIYRGKVADRYGMKTAIHKSLVETPIYLDYEGLEGDQCAEKKFHGGPDRALNHYPIEHYSYWSERFGNAQQWVAAGMGENLSTEGLTEDNVFLGDRFQWGEAVIEVSQPRSPCYKLNKRWGIADFSQQMQDTAKCGWLYRVIETGIVSKNDPLELIYRAENSMTLKKVCELFFGNPLNQQGLYLLQQQSTLSDSWMTKVNQRLITGEVENWDHRLQGPV